MRVLIVIDPSYNLSWVNRLKKELELSDIEVSVLHKQVNGKKLNHSVFKSIIDLFDKIFNTIPAWNFNLKQNLEEVENQHSSPDLILNLTEPSISKSLNALYKATVLDVFANKMPLFHPLVGINTIAKESKNIFIQLRITTANRQEFYQVASLPFKHSWGNIKSRIFSRSIVLILRYIKGFPKLSDLQISSFHPINRISLQTKIQTLFVLFKSNLKRLIYRQQWFLSLTNKSTGDTTFVRKKNHVLADPFPIKRGDKTYVFLEEMKFGDAYGHISYFEVNNNSSFETKKVISENFHLSYPNLIEIKNNLFIVPESFYQGIRFYKCVNFPNVWKLDKVIFEDKLCCDTNIFHFENRWWLMTTMVDYTFAPHCDDLYLFYCEDINVDNWTAHPQNPVVSGSDNSRNAGKVYIKNGRLFRPSQYCVDRYGKAYKINEIILLNENDYREETVKIVNPKNGNIGTHTYNESEEFILEDHLNFQARWK